MSEELLEDPTGEYSAAAAGHPLEDVRIIAVEQYGAGPFGSVHLADLGAEVIKIEDPRSAGDVSRYVPPHQEDEDSLFFETFNRNKRSLSLDLARAAGREVFEDLVRTSDAVYSNLRGDVPDKLGIRYDDLAHLNPAIVCCSLSGFGTTGPRRAEPGYDYILQGLTGWMSLTGEPDGPPTKSGLSVVDFSGGLVAALALVVGIHAARRDGIGRDCDVSLFEVALSYLSYQATWYLTAGDAPTRMSLSAHPSLVPFQNFRTADGWIVVACPKEKFWQRLVDVLGRPDLAGDDRFADFGARHRHRDDLGPILNGIFSGDTSARWLERLSGAGIPCGPVNTLAEALADPQTESRGMIVETEHPRFGPVRQVASPVRVGDEPVPHRRAPMRNEDAPYVLEKILDYSPGRIAGLRMSGAFGDVTAPHPPAPEPA
jgi:crotonobetainyl-CoA:carnitine CoA-transferase CaiB-like acyl-CoA transferase